MVECVSIPLIDILINTWLAFNQKLGESWPSVNWIICDCRLRCQWCVNLTVNQGVDGLLIKYQSSVGKGYLSTLGQAPLVNMFPIIITIIIILFNNDLDKHIQAKTNYKRVQRFSDILAPLSRETKLNMQFQE